MNQDFTYSNSMKWFIDLPLNSVLFCTNMVNCFLRGRQTLSTVKHGFDRHVQTWRWQRPSQNNISCMFFSNQISNLFHTGGLAGATWNRTQASEWHFHTDSRMLSSLLRDGFTIDRRQPKKNARKQINTCRLNIPDT
jgi:hypothetical protein